MDTDERLLKLEEEKEKRKREELELRKAELAFKQRMFELQFLSKNKQD